MCFFLALSVSLFWPIICGPKRTHLVFFAEFSEFAPELSEPQWVLVSETVLSKQYSTCIHLLLPKGPGHTKKTTGSKSASQSSMDLPWSSFPCFWDVLAFFRVFLNPWFGEPVVCTLDSRGFRHFRDFRDFRESSSCLSCLRRFRRFRDFRRFRERSQMGHFRPQKV